MPIERIEKTHKKTLDKIIEEMTKVVEKSKDEIFYISEEAIHGNLSKKLLTEGINLK